MMNPLALGFRTDPLEKGSKSVRRLNRPGRTSRRLTNKDKRRFIPPRYGRSR